MMTFHADGTAVESRLSYIPFGPDGSILETTGHGAWQQLPSNQISAIFQHCSRARPALRS
jgi:hypothetical protein